MTRITGVTAALALALGMAACDSGGDAERDATPAATAATSAGINGEWMIDIDSAQFEGSPEEWVLADGTYECMTCDTPYSVPADGEFHPVEIPNVDELKVEEVDERTIVLTGRKDGEMVVENRFTVSEDGNSATSNSRNMRGAEPVESESRWTRAQAGPDGAHAVSGQWTFDDVEDVSEAGLRATFNVEGDQFTWSGNGERYTATLGGEAVPVEGDEGAMVRVERVGENGYRETFMRDGEETGSVEWTVEGDTLSGVYSSATSDEVTRFTANRVGA